MQDKQRIYQNLFTEVPEDAGPRLATFRGGVVHVTRPPGSQSIDQSEHNLISIMLAPARGLLSAVGSDKLHAYDAETGAIVITPAGMDAHVSWSHTRENATIVLPTAVLRDLAQHEGDTDRCALQPVPFGTVDPWALRIAKLLKAELSQKEAANPLYIESLMLVLGVHLLRQFGTVGRPKAHMKCGLSARQAQKVRRWMEDNISQKIMITDLASVVGLSPHYFIQAFNRTFGKPPHQYLIEMRLDFAETLLAQGDLTIANVAHLCGFSSQSHLTTAMVRHRRVTPLQVRQRI